MFAGLAGSRHRKDWSEGRKAGTAERMKVRKYDYIAPAWGGGPTLADSLRMRILLVVLAWQDSKKPH